MVLTYESRTVLACLTQAENIRSNQHKHYHQKHEMCDSQNPVIRKEKDRVSCAIPHRLGKVKCDDFKTV